MRSSGYQLFLFLAAFGASAPVVSAVDALLEADTYTLPGVTRTKARAATLHASGEAVIYLRFGLDSVLPQGIGAPQIGKATLRLYDRRHDLITLAAVRANFAVLPITEPWDEHLLTATNAPATGPVVKLFSPPVLFDTNGGFIDVDLTELVRDWISGARPNHGLAIRSARLEDQLGGSPFPNWLAVDSKENTATSHEPRLQIVLLPAKQPN